MKTMKMLLAALACVLLISCSKDAPDSPLAYVPADTPYVFASLEPLPAEMRARMFSQLNNMVEANMPVYRGMVETMAKDTPRLGRLFTVLLDELEGKTIEQAFVDMGVDPAGKWVVYGLGFSPVERLPLADPAAFEALLTKLEKAWGEAVPRVTVEDLDVRKMALADSGLALYLAIRDKDAIVAFLPEDKTLLRKALGFDLPEDSLADSDALADLADARGYTMHGLGYVDFTRFPALLIQGGDPLLSQLVANDEVDVSPMEAGCRADLERIAARVPMISFGYSEIQPKRYSVRTNISLAPDISGAFASIKVPLPGLGAETDSMFDLTAAWPIAAIQKFLREQVDAIQAKPFVCPRLAELNQKVDEFAPRVGMLGIVPWTNLRGFRVRLDQLDLADMLTGEAKFPEIEGAIVLASTQPVSLIAVAQSSLPNLFAAPLEPNGGPVAMQASFLDKAGAEASVAMSDQAIAVAIGENRMAVLDQVLDAPIGPAGKLMRVHVSGDLYRSALDSVLGALEQATEEVIEEDGDQTSAQFLSESIQQRIKAARIQFENLGAVDVSVRMDDSGLVMEQTTSFRDAN